VRFGAVGASGCAVGLAVLNVVMLTVGYFLLAKLCSFLCAVSWNFTLDRKWTFESDGDWRRQFIGFVTASSGAAFINWIVSCSLYFGTDFFNTYYNLAALSGVAVAGGFNFLSCKTLVFRGN
jgi:putative flippase GtrA